MYAEACDCWPQVHLSKDKTKELHELMHLARKYFSRYRHHNYCYKSLAN